jgi:hypothetical protein
MNDSPSPQHIATAHRRTKKLCSINGRCGSALTIAHSLFSPTQISTVLSSGIFGSGIFGWWLGLVGFFIPISFPISLPFFHCSRPISVENGIGGRLWSFVARPKEKPHTHAWGQSSG